MGTFKEGVIEVKYRINSLDAGTFDWLLENGDESDEWFESAEEAEADVRRRYS